jgi:succinate dehydrogenase/fumarate reductase cytochrome b subunit
MNLKMIKNPIIIFSVVFLVFGLSNIASACPDEFIAYSNSSTTENFLSSDVLWGLFIIIFHIAIGVIHTIWREKKEKSEVR